MHLTQKTKHDTPTLKQMQATRWFCTSTGFLPIPHDKCDQFFASSAPAKYKSNSRNTQLRTQIRLFAGWDFDANKPNYVLTDAIWHLYFVEKLTKRLHNQHEDSIAKKEETKLNHPKLACQLPAEFFFLDETQLPTDTSPFSENPIATIRRGYAEIAKQIKNDEGKIFDTILSIGAAFFNASFNEPDAAYSVQHSLASSLKPQDTKMHVDNNWPPAHMHKDMRKEFKDIAIKSLRRCQIIHAEQKWVQYFTLNLSKLQAHSDTAHGIGFKKNAVYVPLQNTPLVQAAFDFNSSTTFEALVAEASAPQRDNIKILFQDLLYT